MERLAVRRVARPDDLPRRHEPEERVHVGGVPPRGVDQQIRMRRELAPEPGEVRDGARERGSAARRPNSLASSSECRPSAGIPRPAWIITGSRRSSAIATSSRTAGTVEREALGPRVQLDPPRAGVERAPGLGDRPGVRVDAAVGDEGAVRTPPRRRSRSRWPPDSPRAPASGTRPPWRPPARARRAARPGSACSRRDRSGRGGCGRRRARAGRGRRSARPTTGGRVRRPDRRAARSPAAPPTPSAPRSARAAPARSRS